MKSIEKIARKELKDVLTHQSCCIKDSEKQIERSKEKQHRALQEEILAQRMRADNLQMELEYARSIAYVPVGC